MSAAFAQSEMARFTAAVQRVNTWCGDGRKCGPRLRATARAKTRAIAALPGLLRELGADAAFAARVLAAEQFCWPEGREEISAVRAEVRAAGAARGLWKANSSWSTALDPHLRRAAQEFAFRFSQGGGK